MQTTFHTVILDFGNNTGIEVPAQSLDELGGGKRPPVVVTVAGCSYKHRGRDERSLADLAAEVTPGSIRTQGRRSRGGDAAARRRRAEVDIPVQLQAALDAAKLADTFAGRSYSKRKEFARQVDDAKTRPANAGSARCASVGLIRRTERSACVGNGPDVWR